MLNFGKVVIALLICMIFLIPVNFVSSPVSIEELDQENNDVKEMDDSNIEPTTRSTTSTRSNYQIITAKEISMPEVNASWIQSDWSGGAGQAEWSDDSKYDSSNNMDDSNVNGPLSLGKGEDTDTWKQINDGYERRYRHRIVYNPTRNVFYSFGGVAGWGNVVNEFYEYNPASGAWTQLASGPSARSSSVVVYDTINNLVWVYGGRGEDWDDTVNDLWSYNPNTNSWTSRTDGPGARCDAVGAFNPNTRQIIVYGGYVGGSESTSPEVFVYNTQTHNWIMKKNYTQRYYADAVWCPATNSMLVYGGAERWTGGNYIWENELNEYFPNNDTWTNRTPMGNRVRPILAWDSNHNQLILHGGGDGGGDRNDTWIYNIYTDTWTRKSDGPNPDVDYTDGDWDPVNENMFTFGGRNGNWRVDEAWEFYPNVTGYADDGGLISSTYTTGSKINLRSVSFNVTKPLPPGVDSMSVKIKLAGSPDSPTGATKFVGSTGTTWSYFNDENGQATPASLDGSKYIAYKVNLSTEDRSNSPELERIKIDYYTYPASYEYVSSKYTLPTKLGLPLRYINWTSVEPDDTDIEIYIRQAYGNIEIDTKSWEQVSRGQTVFGYKEGASFQYKAVLKTTEPSSTPILNSVLFTFNQHPTKPALITPANKTWVGESQPVLSWQFSDLDSGDYQTEVEINIAIEDTFTIIQNTYIEETTKNTFKVTAQLQDGEYYWRARVRDNYGSRSTWSDMYVLRIDTKKPSAPIIECFSHPLEQVWYSKSTAAFDWSEPYDVSGIAGYSYTLDQIPETEPPLNVTMTVDEYNIKHNDPNFEGVYIVSNLQNGIWYLHLKAADNLGTWSDTVTRTVKIDIASPTVNDLTPKSVVAGGSFNFRFTINDTESGIDLATISWKYKSEVDYRYDELLKDETTGDYILTHEIEISSDPYIEYYISVDDKADPINSLRHPSSGQNRINIIDNIPPSIIEIPEDMVHNRFNNLVINLEVTDNVAVSDVKIYFNDQSNGRVVSRMSEGKYSITIDRVDLTNLEGYAGENLIIYKVKAWDFQNNSALSPATGNWQITLTDPGTGEDPDTKEPSKEEGLSSELKMNIIILVIIIAIVAVVLFMFVRKQTEKMTEDRHKLRMAIADVTEASSAGSPAPGAGLPATSEIAGLDGPVGAPGTGGAHTLPPIDISTEGAAAAPAPTLATQQAPAGYLPAATTPLGETPPPDPYAGNVLEDSGAVPEQDAYKDAGLMVEPSTTPTPTPQPAAKVDDGVVVSLPSEPKAQPPASAPEEDKSLIWTPPGQGTEQNPPKKVPEPKE